MHKPTEEPAGKALGGMRGNVSGPDQQKGRQQREIADFHEYHQFVNVLYF